MAYADLKQAICDALKALATGEMTPDYYATSGASLDGLPSELTLEAVDGTAVDFDLEINDGLEAEITLLPFYGALRLNADGTGSYTPIRRFVGEDSFAVTVTDDVGQSKTITVKVTITHEYPSLQAAPVHTAPLCFIYGKFE